MAWRECAESDEADSQRTKLMATAKPFEPPMPQISEGRALSFALLVRGTWMLDAGSLVQLRLKTSRSL